MGIKWLFFDLGGTIYDESLSDKQRIDNLIEKADLGITYNDFYVQMQKAAAHYAPSPFTTARNSIGISVNEPYSNEREFLYPNALNVIDVLSKSYQLGIIANQPPNTLERLKKDGLYDFFEICLLSALKLVANCQRGLRADLEYVRLMVAVQLIHQSKQSNTKDS